MNDITKKVLSGMSGDGFNERKGYINRNNDLNNLDKSSNFDQSLPKMRISENKPDIKTIEYEQYIETNQDASLLKTNVSNYNSFKRQTDNSNIVFKRTNKF